MPEVNTLNLNSYNVPPSDSGLSAPRHSRLMRVACPTRFIRDGQRFAVAKGSTTAHVKIGVAPGLVVTSSITDESVNDLGLTAGDAVSAGIKSSDVIIAKQRRPYGLKGGLGRSFGRALKASQDARPSFAQRRLAPPIIDDATLARERGSVSSGESDPIVVALVRDRREDRQPGDREPREKPVDVVHARAVDHSR